MKWLPWRKKNPPQDTARANPASPASKTSSNETASPQPKEQNKRQQDAARNSDFASIVDGKSNYEELVDDEPISFPSDALLSPAYRCLF